MHALCANFSLTVNIALSLVSISLSKSLFMRKSSPAFIPSSNSHASRIPLNLQYIFLWIRLSHKIPQFVFFFFSFSFGRFFALPFFPGVCDRERRHCYKANESESESKSESYSKRGCPKNEKLHA